MESLLLIALLNKRNLEWRRQQQKQKERRVMSRNRHARYGTLSAEDRRRRAMKVPRIALLPPTASAFVRLFRSGDDAALIRLTGFDHGSFRYILAMYTPVIKHVTVDQGSGCIRFKDPKKGGRPRNLNATASLALLLAWTRTKGSNHTLGFLAT